MNWRPPLCFANTGHILRRDTRPLSPHCPKIVPVTIWSSRSCSSLRIRTICSRQGLGRATLKQKWREWNKIETVGVCETSMGRSLHNLSPSLGLACKSFLISASKYIFSFVLSPMPQLLLQSVHSLQLDTLQFRCSGGNCFVKSFVFSHILAPYHSTTSQKPLFHYCVFSFGEGDTARHF